MYFFILFNEKSSLKYDQLITAIGSKRRLCNVINCELNSINSNFMISHIICKVLYKNEYKLWLWLLILLLSFEDDNYLLHFNSNDNGISYHEQ